MKTNVSGISENTIAVSKVLKKANEHGILIQPYEADQFVRIVALPEKNKIKGIRGFFEKKILQFQQKHLEEKNKCLSIASTDEGYGKLMKLIYKIFDYNASIACFINDLTRKPSRVKEIIDIEKEIVGSGIKKAAFSDNLQLAVATKKAIKELREKGVKLPQKLEIRTINPKYFDKKAQAITSFSKEKPVIFLPENPVSSSFLSYINWSMPNEKFSEEEKLLYLIYHEAGHAIDPQIHNKYCKDNPINANEFMKLRKKVSGYAVNCNPIIEIPEYYAEVFAGLMSGRKFDKDVMEMYNNFGGIIPIFK